VWWKHSSCEDNEPIIILRGAGEGYYIWGGRARFVERHFSTLTSFSTEFMGGYRNFVTMAFNAINLKKESAIFVLLIIPDITTLLSRLLRTYDMTPGLKPFTLFEVLFQIFYS